MRKIIYLFTLLITTLYVSTVYGNIADNVENGQLMNRTELIEHALAETGPFIVYGNTSRIATAAENFAALYGIPVEASNLNDGEICTRLRNDSETDRADMVMMQDRTQLVNAINSGLLINFVPSSVKDILEDNEKSPALVHQYINKLFIYNNLGNDVPAIRNVWELTAPEMKGRIRFKNPESEAVNMNFLVMCTRSDWANKLSAAYQEWAGEEIQLGEYENAGYKWIVEFMNNVAFGKSDTTIAEEVSQQSAAGHIALFSLSKCLSSAVITDNLTIGQYEASAHGYKIEPFSGFMYQLYTALNTKANRPYTGMLFIDYLMTQQGFEPWGRRIGTYSPNPNISVNDGDLGINVWKNNLIIEDASFINANIGNVRAALERPIIPEEFEIVNNILIKYNGNETNVIIPNGITTIGERAFENSTAVNITIPLSVTKIHDYAFQFSENLKSITVPDSVIELGKWVFRDCTSLETAFLSSNIETMGLGVFDGCSSLKYVTLPEEITTINSYTFRYCESLKDITITNNITGIGTQAFFGCNSIEEIVIPESVIIIDLEAFGRCQKLTDFIVLGNNPDFTFINDDAFKASYALTTFHTINTYVRNWAIDHNYIVDDNISNTMNNIINIPKDVTIISEESFMGINANIIIVPYTVLRIETRAFANNPNLQYVIIENPHTSLENDILENSPSASIIIK